MQVQLLCTPNPRLRAANALVLAMVAVTLIAGMAVSLNSLTMGRFAEQQRRISQVVLLASAESAANEAVAWMQANANQLKPGTLGVCATLYPTTPPWPNGFVISPKKIVDFPSLNVAGNTAGFRNGCLVHAEIVKLVDTVGGLAKWPDGNEQFMIYATAEAGVDANGNITDPGIYRRERVD